MKADEKKCPQCAEVIKKDARVCKHCGHQFSDADIAAAKDEIARNKKIGCGVAIALVLLVGYCVQQIGPTETVTANSASSETGVGTPATTEVGGTKPASEEPSKWTYNETKDDMRGTTTRYAIIESDNETEFDFPYGGGSRLTLQLRKRPEDGFQIMMTISSGQFLCNSFSNTTINVKFDSGPVRRFGCTGTSAGNSDTIFLESTGTFLSALRKANTVVVEPEFYQSGRRQFTFSTKGLKWK